MKYSWDYIKRLGEYRARTLLPVQSAIRRYRIVHKLSQREMAKLIGCSHQAICDWERGRYKAPERVMQFVEENND